MGLFKKKEKVDYSFKSYPQLLEIKPREGYIFHSDYYKVDNHYATILSFFHTEGATDGFGAFWGINRIPSGLGDNVVSITFEQVRRMTEGWIADNQSRSEGIAQMNENEQNNAGTSTTRGKASRKTQDLQEIAQEIQDGASYLHCQYRLLLKAPTLAELDDAVKKIDRLYIDRFATLSAAPYIGEQKKELSTLFSANEKKMGKGFYFTSTELAGSYSLVTHGLEDAKGEYVGYMVGDVNNSAVLFDVDGYGHHTVIANENYDMSRDRVHVSDEWGSKISQACLLNNHKVVHLILDGANMDKLGPKFESITYRVDLNKGDVNMFEMFGDENDEMAIFASQMKKLILMAEQAYEPTDSDRSIIRGMLEEVATQFYVDKRMWYQNAKAKREKLRVVNIPHTQLPKLEEFVSYLAMEEKAMENATAYNAEKLHAFTVLHSTFQNLLSSNGDLFNNYTSDAIDGAKTGRRVLYDFSKLMMRGKGIAMAQFVNVVGFAAGNLGYGDTVIIHGAELLDDGIKDYIESQFAYLWDKGGRVVYLYNDMDKMLADKSFSHFDKADYTVFGNMSDTFVQAYQKELGQSIPPDLERLITNKSCNVCYIRRGFDNVVFQQDLCLDIQKKKGRRR